jgi:tol-pal system protein YbgF
MTRASLALLSCLLIVAPASAQTAQEVGEMRLYVQDLEERVRQLTGQNEQLTYELNQLRAQLGQAPAQSAPEQTGALTPQPGQDGQVLGEVDLPPAAPPQDPGTLSVSRDDPLIAPDGLEGAPVDLSIFAGGTGEAIMDPQVEAATPEALTANGETQTAGLPGTPPPTTALSGSPRDEYDLAYGYILTGDYNLAEESFRIWLANFPDDAQAVDAQFWLGESHLQQGEYQEAANAFLAVYKMSPDSTKGPDALLKLGISLAALGETSAACATFAEVGRKYPQASQALMSRVRDEEGRAGC